MAAISSKIGNFAKKKVSEKLKKMQTGPSPVNSGEWIMIVLLFAFIDLSQIILDFLVIGIVINEIVDIFVGIFLVIYLFLRKQISDSKSATRALAIVAVSFIGEEVPILDAAPFWTGDILYFWYLSNVRNKEFEASKEGNKKEKSQEKIQSQQEQQSRIMQIREQQQAQDDQREQQRLQNQVRDDDEDLYDVAA